MIKTTKTFYSIEAVNKYYFPKQYREETEAMIIEKIGFGTWLAQQFFRKMMRRKLKALKKK